MIYIRSQWQNHGLVIALYNYDSHVNVSEGIITYYTVIHRWCDGVWMVSTDTECRQNCIIIGAVKGFPLSTVYQGVIASFMWN